jgi:hypothetical protein
VFERPYHTSAHFQISIRSHSAQRKNSEQTDDLQEGQDSFAAGCVSRRCNIVGYVCLRSSSSDEGGFSFAEPAKKCIMPQASSVHCKLVHLTIFRFSASSAMSNPAQLQRALILQAVGVALLRTPHFSQQAAVTSEARSQVGCVSCFVCERSLNAWQ